MGLQLAVRWVPVIGPARLERRIVSLELIAAEPLFGPFSQHYWNAFGMDYLLAVQATQPAVFSTFLLPPRPLERKGEQY